ncbi:MAG: sulfatase-like hydrolase/transferase, partial [Pricia sp.]
MMGPLKRKLIRSSFHLTILGILFLFTGDIFGQEQYNVLWITVEDMSPRLGCYGDSTVATPNIDRLAAEGVRYTNAYGTYGVCAPNRHTLITGMYPTSTGAMAMRTHKRTSALDQITDPELLAIPVYEATPPAGVKCFTEFLREKGYYCTNNSKTDYQFKTPVTAWDESNDNAHWRNRPSKKTPFFSVFNSGITHESKTFRESSPKVTDPKSVEVPPYYPDTPTVRSDIARQYDNIHSVDQWVGEILDQLQKDGLMDKT